MSTRILFMPFKIVINLFFQLLCLSKYLCESRYQPLILSTRSSHRTSLLSPENYRALAVRNQHHSVELQEYFYRKRRERKGPEPDSYSSHTCAWKERLRGPGEIARLQALKVPGTYLSETENLLTLTFPVHLKLDSLHDFLSGWNYRCFKSLQGTLYKKLKRNIIFIKNSSVKQHKNHSVRCSWCRAELFYHSLWNKVNEEIKRR